MNNYQVHIYTDGAAKGNPGNGGYGVVMEWVGQPYKKEFYEGFRHTTNNRMELLAVIVALEKLKNPKTPQTARRSGFIRFSTTRKHTAIPAPSNI